MSEGSTGLAEHHEHKIPSEKQHNDGESGNAPHPAAKNWRQQEPDCVGESEAFVEKEEHGGT